MALLPPGMQHVRNYYHSEPPIIGSSFSRPFIAHSYRNSFQSKQKLSKAAMKIEAAKKHSEAEQRRRKRINIQYETLRKELSQLTNLIKRDKATVLTETIKQVKELKEKVSKVEESSSISMDEKFVGGYDHVEVKECKKGSLVKATLSCEDREGLMSSIAKALGSVKAKVVKADMVTIGGRTSCVLWLQCPQNKKVLESSLRAVMHRPQPFKMTRFTQSAYRC